MNSSAAARPVRADWASRLSRAAAAVLLFELFTGLAVTFGAFHPAVEWGLILHTAAGVLALRKTQPERKRGFRVPWCPLLPALSIVFCLVLMMALPLETWLRLVVWLILGLILYFAFGYRHSVLRQQSDASANR